MRARSPPTTPSSSELLPSASAAPAESPAPDPRSGPPGRRHPGAAVQGANGAVAAALITFRAVPGYSPPMLPRRVGAVTTNAA
jgi:hypothetical protein